MVKVICTIIGTFIGAGFASGKEVYLFFFKYGFYGIIGAIISSVSVGYVIFKTIKIIKNNMIENYDEFLDYTIKNKIIKIILNNIIDIFLIISFCVMISGFCAFLEQEFNISKIMSHILILVICYFIFQKNINGITKINDIVIPFIILIIIYIALVKTNKACDYFLENIKIEKVNFKFLLDSLIYANYNLLTIVPIIITIQKFITKKKNIKKIAIISSIIIFILSMAIFILLLQTRSNISNLEMPIIYIVGKYGKQYKYIYSLIIGVAIFTTAISSGYGYLQKYESDKKIYNKKIIYLMLGTILSVQIGFSRLIEILYPMFGFIGIIQSIYIIKSRDNI